MRYFVTLLLLLSAAWAHNGDYTSSMGFHEGIMHPLMGIDHLLVMLGVGVVASLVSPRLALSVPLFFVAMLLLGAFVAFMGVTMPAVETLIALSVLATGLLLLAAPQKAMPFGAVILGSFALFHGAAHAAEFTFGSLALYITGFSLTTLSLHFSGYLLGRILSSMNLTPVIRLGGAAVTLASIPLLA